MIEINSRQRKLLEKYAHSMPAFVLIGGAGVTEQLTEQVNKTLSDHELIKIKFNEYKDEKKELTDQIAADTNSLAVRIIGNTAILYRPAEKESDRRYEKELSKLL